jgi:hypothetical protein
MAAHHAFYHGFFAPDNDRRELWQAAYRLYHLLCESGQFDAEKMAIGHHAWSVDDCANALTKACLEFEFLKRFMSGNFNVEGVTEQMLYIATGCGGYFRLPPKADGEPVIEPPHIEMSFDFGEEINEEPTETADEDGDFDDGDDDFYCDEETDDDGETVPIFATSQPIENAPCPTSPTVEQMSLF